MTTAISTGAEAPHPSPPRSQAYNSISRSQSTRNRAPPSAGSGLPTRAASQHRHNHSSSSGRPVQEVLPHRDYEREQTNVAQYSKRSSSRDGPPPESSSRPQRRSSQHSPHHASPPAADMPATVANNAGPVPGGHAAAADPRATGAHKPSRSRTTIPTQSGKWILGKTIGAGSMGKVKLARKEDTGEQVSLIHANLAGNSI